MNEYIADYNYNDYLVCEMCERMFIYLCMYVYLIDKIVTVYVAGALCNCCESEVPFE